MIAGHNYKIDMLPWKAVTEKDRVIESYQMKFYLLLWCFAQEGEYDPSVYKGNI